MFSWIRRRANASSRPAWRARGQLVGIPDMVTDLNDSRVAATVRRAGVNREVLGGFWTFTRTTIRALTRRPWPRLPTGGSAASGFAGGRQPVTDDEAHVRTRLDMMDEAGVGLQVLSPA